MSSAGLREAIASVAGTASRLSRLSQRSYQNPYQAVDWPERVDPERDWFSSPELVSLYATPVWDRLAEPDRRRLAFHEAANFYSLNIHGEKGLIQGLAARLYRRDLVDVAPYLHNFLDEENKHSIFFGGFCTRYAQVYRSRHVPFDDPLPRDVDDFLFFAKTMIFEEIVDRYNWLQGRDARLHQLARFINNNHHFEESRHLVFGRQLVAALWRGCAPDWDADRVADVRGRLTQFFVTSWREYYNPDVYADAALTGTGFADPWELAEAAWSDPAQRAHRRELSAKCVTFLLTTGILTEEPTDAY
jgi:P-aminobenzoate N-oxygenase AurF